MQTIPIEGISSPISRLIMGSDYFTPDRQELVSSMLDAFLDAGGNVIDTAHVYMGGASERAIGGWLSARNNRSKVVILTKGAHHDASGPRVNAAAIRSDLEESLNRLQTSYIDLYALHRDDETQPVGGIVEALNEHIEAGRIHAIGVSNWTTARIEAANAYAETNGLIGFTFSSPNLSLAKAQEPYWAGCVSADADICRWHQAHQFPLLSWSSQARGFFTGRFSPEVRDNADIVRVFYNDANWKRLDRARSMAEERGVTAIQIALAYVLNQPFPTAAIIGPQTPDELKSCVEAATIRLTESEIRWLEG